MPGRLEFGFNFGGRDAAPRPEGDETPVRLLLIGDFSGRDSRGDSTTGDSLATRRIDIDNFETVMKQIDPAVNVTAEDGSPSGQILFHTLEDFHPDELFARVPIFNAMQQLRADLGDSARFADAVARLGADAPPGPEATDVPAGGTPAASASPFDQLLGGQPAAGGATTSKRAAGTIDRLISDAIAPHITPGEDPKQAQYIASCDLAISTQMRELLGEPRFKSLESAWRGIWWLVAHADPEAVEIHLLDIDRAGLVADLGDPQSRVTRRLVDGRGAGEAPWAMLFGLYEFADEATDLALLTQMGELASRLGGSFVGGAAPALLGGSSWLECADPPVVERSPLATEETWRAFRAGPVASRVGLAGPRVLLRLPYGPDTDEIDAFAFTELVSPDDHGAFLWGNPAIAIAMLVILDLSDEDGPAGGHLLLDDLPAHSYRIDDESHLTPGAECYLGERAAEAMLTAGIMPLMSMKNRNAVQVMRLQSIASPPTPLVLASV